MFKSVSSKADDTGIIDNKQCCHYEFRNSTSQEHLANWESNWYS